MRHSTWNMYLSRRFRWSKSAESNSVLNDNEASASETSFSRRSPSEDSSTFMSVMMHTDLPFQGQRSRLG